MGTAKKQLVVKLYAPSQPKVSITIVDMSVIYNLWPKYLDTQMFNPYMTAEHLILKTMCTVYATITT